MSEKFSESTPSESTASTGTASKGTATTAAKASGSGASKLFDLRYLIGGLFVVYGVILSIAGFFTTDQADKKANGININLWLGLAMLALGLFFLGWARLRPLLVEPAAAESGSAGQSGQGRPGH